MSDAQETTDLSAAILDVAGAAMCVVDSKGTIVRWNRAAAALTGISAEQIRGHVFEEALLFPGDIDKWKLEFDRISAGTDLPPRHFQIRWKIHDGSPISLTCCGSVVRDSAGEVRHIVCTVIDGLSREVLTDRIAELRDISRVLHETITQDLVALSFYVSELEAAARDLPSRTHAEATLEMIDRCCRDIRIISYMLAPPSLYETTLEASIELLASSVRDEVGLTIAVDIDPVPESVSPEARVLFFAAVQSWVARGIRSHPRPELSVRLENRTDGTVLQLEMVSAGYTLPAPAVPSNGWGFLRGITRALGGEFDLAGDLSHVSARMWLPG